MTRKHFERIAERLAEARAEARRGTSALAVLDMLVEDMADDFEAFNQHFDHDRFTAASKGL